MKRPRVIHSISIDAALSSVLDTLATTHGMTRSRVIELALGLCISHSGGFQKILTAAILEHDFAAMLSATSSTPDNVRSQNVKSPGRTAVKRKRAPAKLKPWAEVVSPAAAAGRAKRKSS
jgi:hypothetical protein